MSDNNRKNTVGMSGSETLDKGLLDAVSSVVNSNEKIRMSDSDQYVDRVNANLPEDDSEMISESDYEPADSMGKYRGAHRMNLPKKKYTAADEKEIVSNMRNFRQMSKNILRSTERLLVLFGPAAKENEWIDFINSKLRSISSKWLQN